MNYKNYKVKTTFIELYEELSTLNEAHPTNITYLTDIIGYKEGVPVLKGSDNSNKKSLLDFVDIQATKDLDQDTLAEDPTTWGVSSKDTNKFILYCNGKNCRSGGRHDLQAKSLYFRIYKKQPGSAWWKFSDEQTVEEIALCQYCVQDRNNQNKCHTVQAANVGGCDNGKLVLASTMEDSVVPHIHRAKSLIKNADLADMPVETWPVLNKDRTFCYICPSCGIGVELKGSSIQPSTEAMRDKKYTAADMIKCNVCKRKIDGSAKTYRAAELIVDIPEVWERIPSWLFVDKSLDKEAVLTKNGIETLLKNNSSHGLATNKAFLQSLALAMTNSSEIPVIKAAKHLYKGSELKLPWVCTNLDCITANKGTNFQYTAKVRDVTRGVYRGCPYCAKKFGRQHSASEIFLKDSVELLFNVKHINEQTKIKPFADIDILFKTQDGNAIGIEYDGRRYHQDPKTINADERKVTSFGEQQGIHFMRVREAGCAPFNGKLAVPPIEIKKEFISLSFDDYLRCLTEIGNGINHIICNTEAAYEIPPDILPELKLLFKQRGRGGRSSGQIKQAKQNKQYL